MIHNVTHFRGQAFSRVQPQEKPVLRFAGDRTKGSGTGNETKDVDRKSDVSSDKLREAYEKALKENFNLPGWLAKVLAFIGAALLGESGLEMLQGFMSAGADDKTIQELLDDPEKAYQQLAANGFASLQGQLLLGSMASGLFSKSPQALNTYIEKNGKEYPELTNNLIFTGLNQLLLTMPEKAKTYLQQTSAECPDLHQRLVIAAYDILQSEQGKASLKHGGEKSAILAALSKELDEITESLLSDPEKIYAEVSRQGANSMQSQQILNALSSQLLKKSPTDLSAYVNEQKGRYAEFVQGLIYQGLQNMLFNNPKKAQEYLILCQEKTPELAGSLLYAAGDMLQSELGRAYTKHYEKNYPDLYKILTAKPEPKKDTFNPYS